MDIKAALDILKKEAPHLAILESLNKNRLTPVLAIEAARAFCTATVYKDKPRPVLVVCATSRKASAFKESLALWLGQEKCLLLPETELMPYQRASDSVYNAMQRINTLRALMHGTHNEPAPVIVTSARALAFPVPSHATFSNAWYALAVGDEINPEKLAGYLLKAGYRPETVAAQPGEMSRRGGIFDIFPVNADNPVRIDFFGNTIEEMRLYNPETQLSLGPIEQLVTGPASEFIASNSAVLQHLQIKADEIDLSSLDPDVYSEFSNELQKLKSGEHFPECGYYTPLYNGESILNYIPRDALVVLDDAAGIETVIQNLCIEEHRHRKALLEQKLLPAGFPEFYHCWDSIESRLETLNCLYYYDWETPDIAGALKAGFTPPLNYALRYEAFARDMSVLIKDKKRVFVVSHQAERLSELLADFGITAAVSTTLEKPPIAAQLAIVKGIADGGWVYNKDFYFFTDVEILGFVKQNRQAYRYKNKAPLIRDQLKNGDYVVHIDHGIARFQGITSISSNDIQREYLVLEYEGQDRLYVPVDQIDRVERYIGSGDTAPALNRLGTGQWQKTKEKAQEAAQEIAAELLELYSERQVIQGFCYSPDSVWQREMEASFPYVETPDQLKAISDIKKDMADPRPMDRLLLGDVGYGKTEVAVRAAFKAVQDGRQVAVLVPTTLLAQQHYITFKQRLSVYPVTVESLSRFQSAKQQTGAIESIRAGKADIVIGTHRLLQKDVIFKNLGLIIIDEEQRFGVRHKEYLKQKRKEVDVLTLSATPIPRTLHMALSGVRDMSAIETPPEQRMAVNTFVSEYRPGLIREAVLRELERSGQVFFVHNRVNSIHMVCARLKDLIPEARFGIAHGQMSEEDLAQNMMAFTAGDIDVLVCTTIVESGLDVPNANTLIVNRADKLGLIQLHQLRGRIGRGALSGYAYFLYDRGNVLTDDARRRLQTIYELAELGSGYNIAMKDLEIRGAGTLLGTHQSGHIGAVGFNLYTRFLSSAVEQQKARREGSPLRPERHLPDPAVDLPVDCVIPESYIENELLRLGFYQRVSRISHENELAHVSDEITDRFGPFPDEVNNLLYMARIKFMAKTAGVGSINTENGNIVLLPLEGLRFDRRTLSIPDNAAVWVNPLRISIDTRKAGSSWKILLEQILGSAVTGS